MNWTNVIVLRSGELLPGSCGVRVRPVRLQVRSRLIWRALWRDFFSLWNPGIKQRCGEAAQTGRVQNEGTELSYGIFVINLPDALERSERVRRHLADLGLDSAVIIDAVRGSLLSASERGLLADDARSVARYGRTLTAGELGCALSHVRTYERLLAGSDDFALILEDDAVLLPDVVRLLSSESVQDWLMQPEPRLLLMTPVRAFLERGALPLPKGYRLVRVRRAWEGYGYLVNRAAAEVMRRINSPASLSADDWVAYRKLGGVELRGVDPFCIGFLETAPSQLEDDRRRVEMAPGRSRSLEARLEKWGRQFMDLAYYRPIWGLGRHRMPSGWPVNRK